MALETQQTTTILLKAAEEGNAEMVEDTHPTEQPAPRPDSAFLDGLENSPEVEVRILVAAHPDATPQILTRLSEDESWVVRETVAENPNTPESVRESLAEDPHPQVRHTAVNSITEGGESEDLI